MQRNFTKIIVCLAILGLLVLLFTPAALAGTLTTLKDILNRLKAGETSGITHKIIFTTETAVSGGAGANKVIEVAPDADDVTWCAVAGAGTATGCTDESSTALPGTLTVACTVGAGASSYDTITVSGVDDLAATTKYCVDINDTGTASLGTPAAGSHTMTIKTNNGASDVDTGEAVIQILTDDQVAVSATVGASLSFSITDTTIGFSSLSTSAPTWATGDTNGSASETSAHDLTTSTNSTSGYSVTVKGDTLKDNGNSITAIGGTAADVSAGGGTEQFGIRLTASGGSGAAVAPYNGAANMYAYAATATTEDEVASSAGASDTTTFSVFYAANIAGSTEAGAYSATLTYICTGQY